MAGSPALGKTLTKESPLLTWLRESGMIMILAGGRDWVFRAGRSSGQRSFRDLQGMMMANVEGSEPSFADAADRWRFGTLLL